MSSPSGRTSSPATPWCATPGASGDFNPIHYRDDVATAVGLPGVLAHGMLTMGLAVQPVVDWLGDPGRIIDYQVRFTRPVPVDAADGADRRRPAKVGALDDGGARIDLTVACDGEHRARQGAGAREAGLIVAATFAGADDPRASAGPRAVDPSRGARSAGRTPPEMPGAAASDWLVLGGGSNIVVSDEGFDGHGRARRDPRHRATATHPAAGSPDLLRVQAGEPWDAVVAYAVEHGLAGIEALSGIPGSSGAAPIQNIGAYGQELGHALVAVEFLDYGTGELERIPPARAAVRLPHLRLQAGPPRVWSWRSSSSWPGPRTAQRPRSPTRSWRTPSGVQIGDRVPLARSARPPCSLCVRRRAWCCRRTTPIRSAPARSSPTRS